MKRRSQAEESAARVRNLISLDAANVMRRLEERKGEMIALFSRLRNREPMLQTIHSRFITAGFGELVHLSLREQEAVNHFYEILDELRWYFTYTEDMPSTAAQMLVALHRKLDESHQRLLAVLGPPVSFEGEAVVVEAEVVRPAPAAESTALAEARPARRKRGRAGGAK